MLDPGSLFWGEGSAAGTEICRTSVSPKLYFFFILFLIPNFEHVIVYILLKRKLKKII